MVLWYAAAPSAHVKDVEQESQPQVTFVILAVGYCLPVNWEH